MWRDFNKNWLTLLKLCVSSFLCGFRADLGLPWVPETFLARFPASVKSLFSRAFAARGFGPRPKMCRPSANTENFRRTREKPLVPRVIYGHLMGQDIGTGLLSLLAEFYLSLLHSWAAETIVFSLIQFLIFWTLRNSADGHISTLGHLWNTW